MFKNLSKKTIIHILIITILCIINTIVITRFNYIYGSNTDWLKQHVSFSSYFRNLFYETKNIFPNLAPHLGAGQNIFNFAYYGLYNPIILISYLFFFIDMADYIMISSVLVVYISTCLLYFFLKNNKYDDSVCFFSSLLLLFSSSFLFHSHRHIMFINYMPFLILSLMGVNRYFNKKRSDLLIISTSLIILTSYYYSITSLISIFLYGLYYYLKINNKINFKNLFTEAIKFIFRISISILLVSFFLLPVIYTTLNGRISNSSLSLFDVYNFIPKINLSNSVYYTYGIGLASIVLIGLIYNILYNKKEHKILSILILIILSFPIFNLILNGMLYYNEKVFIPLLPIIIFEICEMLKHIKEIKFNYKLFLIIFLISSFILFGLEIRLKMLYFIIEASLFIFLILLYKKYNKTYFLIPITLIAMFFAYTNSIGDDLISVDSYNIQKGIYSIENDSIINGSSSNFYRINDEVSGLNSINYSYAKNDYKTGLYSSLSNLNYLNNYYEVFNNNNNHRNMFMLSGQKNLFFNKFMGVKYIIQNNSVPYGYKEVKKYKYAKVYENENVYPIAYISNNLLNELEYDNLEFNEKLEAYLNNIIIKDSSSNQNLNTVSKLITLDYEIEKSENLEYKKEDNNYIINSYDNSKLVLNLKNNLENKSIFIRFKMNEIPSCITGDTSITINSITNKLTCKDWKYYNNNEVFDYFISSNDTISKLTIKFSKGKYNISDILVYEIDNSFFSQDNNILPINIDSYNNDKLIANVDNNIDGYLIFTIPYDKGFKLKIDNKVSDIEIVNKMFIGSKITKGKHNIVLEYSSPYFKEGKILSIVSIFMFSFIIIYEKKRFK